jgi:Peptidase M50B-like
VFHGGYWILGRFRGAQVKLHWSILVGAFVFARFQLSLGFLLAFPCLILVHEFGHALLAARLGHRVVGIEATGFGGVCQWSGNASPFDEALIAWGGVLAQLVLYVAAELWLSSSFRPSSVFGWQVAGAFTHTNLYLVAVNLMPIPPLDGARAWTIFSAWKDRGVKGVPYGTWRDPSADAQRAWFDGSRGKRPKQERVERRRGAGVTAESDPSLSEEGPLDAESQRAIDELLRRATGKGSSSDERDR